LQLRQELLRAADRKGSVAETIHQGRSEKSGYRGL
jgi:hypothetical protein